MTKTVLAAAILLGLQTQPSPYTERVYPSVSGIDVCTDDEFLMQQMLSRYMAIQRDQYRSLPWRVFVVMRDFQRNGFRVTDRIRATICDGDRWLYGDSQDDATVPHQAPPLRQSVFDTVG